MICFFFLEHAQVNWFVEYSLLLFCFHLFWLLVIISLLSLFGREIKAEKSTELMTIYKSGMGMEWGKKKKKKKKK